VARHDLRQVPVDAQAGTYAGDRSARALVLANHALCSWRRAHCNLSHAGRNCRMSVYPMADNDHRSDWMVHVYRRNGSERHNSYWLQNVFGIVTPDTSDYRTRDFEPISLNRIDSFWPRLTVSPRQKRDDALQEIRLARFPASNGFPVVEWEPPGNGKSMVSLRSPLKVINPATAGT
jgi:hypothetical protein